MLDDIRDLAGDEHIEAVVFGKWDTGWPEEKPSSGFPPTGLLTIEQAEPYLALRYDSGFGCFQGFHFTAWSKSWVLFWSVYDGAQRIQAVPRNPCTLAVEPVGGG